MPIKPFLAAVAVVSLCLAGGKAESQTQPTPRPEPQDQPSAEALAREGVDKLLQALQQVLRNLPQYDMPRLNERGDIIIKRLNPPPQKPPAAKPPSPSGNELRT